MEELQINLIALEQAVIYTLVSFFFFFCKIFRCPLFCIQHYLSCFLFLVCICLFKSPSQTGQEWDKGEITGVISQSGDISQVLWWKKKSNLYLLFHTFNLLSSSWNICLILLNKKIFRKLCWFLVTVSWTTWTWEKLAWCLLVLKMQNIFFLGISFTCWLNEYFSVSFKSFQWFLCHLECLSKLEICHSLLICRSAVSRPDNCSLIDKINQRKHKMH